MKGIKNLENWRAEEIAKVYLLNSGLVTLLPNYTDNFDFLAISKNLPDKKIAVEVQPTKYSQKEIKKVFSKTRRKFAQSSLPGILMYIDYDKENGYFEVFEKSSEANHIILPLQTDKLKEQISQLIS